MKNIFRRQDPLRKLLVEHDCDLPFIQPNTPMRKEKEYEIYSAKKVNGKIVLHRDTKGNYKVKRSRDIKDKLTIGSSAGEVYVRIGTKWEIMS